MQIFIFQTFDVVQRSLCLMKLVLNADQTKMMCFLSLKRTADGVCQIITMNNEGIESELTKTKICLVNRTLNALQNNSG